MYEITAREIEMKRRRTISRPRYIAPGDTRCPMLRLLQDNVAGGGQVEPDYEQQFRTMFKAQRLGYLDDDRRLTDAGKEFVSKASALTSQQGNCK